MLVFDVRGLRWRWQRKHRPPPPAATPTGAYTITVTATSGTLIQTMRLMLYCAVGSGTHSEDSSIL